MLLGILSTSLLQNLLTAGGVKVKISGTTVKRRDESRADQFFLITTHLLTNFEIQKYYENTRRCNDVSSRKNLPKLKFGAYVMILNEYKLT